MIEEEFALWANSLPEPARSTALARPPSLYLNTQVDVRQVMVPISYENDGTMTVLVLANESEGGENYIVFGVECSHLAAVEAL
jgi:hypothetical protein